MNGSLGQILVCYGLFLLLLQPADICSVIPTQPRVEYQSSGCSIDRARVVSKLCARRGILSRKTLRWRSAIPTLQIPLEKHLTHGTSLSFKAEKAMALMEKRVFLSWSSHPEMDDNYIKGAGIIQLRGFIQHIANIKQDWILMGFKPANGGQRLPTTISDCLCHVYIYI